MVSLDGAYIETWERNRRPTVALGEYQGEYDDWDKRNGLVECLKVEHKQGRRCNSPQPCLRTGAVIGCKTLLAVGHSVTNEGR